MNLDKITTWITGIVIAASLAGQLPKLQLAIWKAQAKTIAASKTSTWGSPRFFANRAFRMNSPHERGTSKLRSHH